jgi:[ribosomal protein S5]-alanine N-acetyltransferase
VTPASTKATAAKLRTARLVLRPVAPDDHTRLHALFTQPGVRRVIFDDEIIPPERTAEIIRISEESFRTRRFGLWLASGSGLANVANAVNVASETIGFGAFWYFRDPPELELLYGVGDAYVKRGYGREIARAIVGYGFDTLQLPEIRASTDPAHADSRRLLDDLGFAFERQAVAGGLDTVFYSKRRA